MAAIVPTVIFECPSVGRAVAKKNRRTFRSGGFFDLDQPMPDREAFLPLQDGHLGRRSDLHVAVLDVLRP